MPDRSGVPSGSRGAGAARSGLPSAFRGIPSVGYRSHCATPREAAPVNTRASAIVQPVLPIPRPSCLLCPRPLQPFVVLLALGAELIDQLGVGLEAFAQRDRKRFGVDLRIVDGQL